MNVDFWFDPICPWCWITSRWLDEVSRSREVAIRWRPFSLLLKNQGNEDFERFRPSAEAGHRMLRVIEAARRRGDGAELPGQLYTEFGTRIHHDRQRPEEIDIAAVLAASGLPRELAEAADDAGRDSQIRESMTRALMLAGDDVGVPLVAFNDRVAFFGPVMSPAPSGEAALRLFDSLAAMGGQEGFFELKRTRDVGPIFGPRPELQTALSGKRAGHAAEPRVS